MADDSRKFYGDETITGRSSPAFRNLGRATIAARTSDANGFKWLLQLKRDYLPEINEPKSNLVLELIQHNSFARELVLAGIGTSAILIIDFAEYYRGMFAQMCNILKINPPDAPESIDFLLRGQHRQLASQILQMAREGVVYTSALPAVQAIFRDAIKASDIPVGLDDELVDHRVIGEFSEPEFREILARFSMAFADALDPEKHALKLVEIAEMRFIPQGYFSLVVLGDVAEADLTLDIGSINAYEQVRRAHELVNDRLAPAQLSRLGRQTTPGRLRQEDSRAFLGIQAADIAAGMAVLIYENYPNNRRQGAMALKQIFERVFLNDDWV